MADSNDTPSAPAPAPAPEKKSSGGGTCITIAITALITFVLTAAAVGGGVYLWQKAVCVVERDDLSSAISTTNVANNSSTTTDDSASTSYDMTVEGTSPTDNTENFIVLTLGTVPGATLDYDTAKTYLSASERAKCTDDSDIPLFYGIQEGPDTYEMKTQTINGNDATVKVDVLYGEMMESWAFTLIWQDGAWKIDGFRNDAQ